MNNKVNGMFYKANEREFIPMQCEAVYIAPLSKKLPPQIRGVIFSVRVVWVEQCAYSFAPADLSNWMISSFPVF